ncbi:MAG: hypothetical protein FJW31_06590 [Acidobacteria bacterium]|nr:hypothetical protein [Acidobacteriota bacterium]
MSTPALFCRNCGRALNDEEKGRLAVFCTGCGSAFASAAPPPPSSSGASTMRPMADPNISPGLAFLLGLIPGVGAIYNSQYAKGLVHVFLFGRLISVADNAHELGPFLGFMVAGCYLYMPFEAYHTAQRRQRGEPVDEFSSILPLQGKVSGFPVGPLVMIGVGLLFLLNNLGLLRISQVVRLWPVALIALGAIMLRDRRQQQ